VISATVKGTWNGPKVKKCAERTSSKSIFSIGLEIMAQAKEFAARKYGYLAASINLQTAEGRRDIESPGKYQKEAAPIGHDPGTFANISETVSDTVGYVGTVLDYAPYVEYGTKFSWAQPFMRPAIDIIFGRALNLVEAHGRKEFSEYLEQPRKA
jgi:hypothetical protein